MSFAFLNPFVFSTDDLPLYSGHDGGIQSVTHPLITFLLDLSKSYVGSTGNDSLACGVSLLPCETLTRAMERLVSEESPEMEIVIVDSGILNSSLAIDGISLLVTSVDKKVVNVDGGSFDVSTGSLTFTSIEINLPLTSVTNTPFAVSGGALRFDPSSRLSHAGTVTTPTSLLCPLMSVAKGSLEIKGSLTQPHSFSSFVNTASSECCLIQVGGDQDSSASLTITHSHFTSCSNLHGATLCFFGSRMGTVTMTSCYFSLNKGSTSNDILATEEWKNTFTPATIQKCYSDSDLNHLLIGQTSENDLVPFSVLGVNSLNANDDTCHLHDVSCSSVKKALSLCEQNETADKYALRLIEMETSISELATLTVASRQIILSASVDTISLEWTGTGSLMTITNGSVSLNSFKLVDSVPSSTAPLIVLSDSGSLSLTSIIFEGSSISKHSVVETHAGLLSVSTSQFSKLPLSECALFETKSHVAIEKCQFIDITQESQGPTVLSATISDSATVSVLNTSFSGCTASDSERWISLKGRDQTTFLPSSWIGTFNKTSPWSGVVVDDSTKPIDSEFRPYSLLYEFFPSTEATLYVASTTGNVDHPLCGHSQFPCHSIDVGRSLTSIDTIEIISIGEIGGILTVGNSTVALSGHNGRGRMIMLRTGRFVSDDEDDPGQLIISKLEIDVSSSTLTDLSLFFIKTGTMEVSSCSIISTQPIPFSLIQITGDNLTLHNIVFSINTTKTGALLRSLKGNVKMEEITISSISLESPAFSIANSPSVYLSKIDFTSPKTGESSVSELISTLNVSSFLLSQSDFVGSKASQNEEENPSCEWSSGLLTLNDTVGTITGTRFSSLHQGGLLIADSNITLSGCTFTLNTPLSTPSASFRRNVRCVGHSVLEIESVHAGDGQDTTAHWISNDEDCLVTRQMKQFSAPLFIPTLNTSSTKCTFTKKTQTFALTLTGTMFIRCGLLLQVFEHEVKDPKSVNLDLSTLGGEWTEEKMITLSLAMSAISLNPTHEWRARLVYGYGEQTESFCAKLSATDERKSQTINTMKWLGPVIGAIVAVIVFFLILIVLLRRHRKKKDAENQKKPLAAQELDESMMDIEKIDTQDSFADTTYGVHSHFETPSHEVSGYTKNQPQNEQKESAHFNVLVASSEQVKEAVIPQRQDTLYNRLHNPLNGVLVDVGSVRKQIIAGLIASMKDNPNATILTNLSPHFVFFDSAGVVQLQVPQHPHPSQAVGESKPMLEKGENEGDRWKAPEVAQETTTFDPSKAAVFSLGLLLWEMETLQVPFSEYDALNAQRQISLGIQPPMTGIESESLVTLIESCLALNPKERPTLEDIADAFSPPSLHSPSRNTNTKRTLQKNEFVALVNVE
ncbi:hypothetical protein BLNAU_13692 [Blattamonas nauphoetae]|uniref:Protein kinase domain-containing protein n=1 Tax=Blattamonas nauphoetae TaxID=2049346 RepID=A0ABQ9XG18_9EUKA|nr:hypothetical protein BLNAU_13692 [Blattamonas nauphoetae]